MTFDLRQLQLIQLEILNELKRVCEKNNITFYLACGTCLGAVRHKGFIPWDDDVDVFMMVEDFDKFVKLTNEFNSKFFLQTTETDRNYQNMIARVRMNGTTLFEKDELNVDCHHGVFLDVYPLFGYPSNFFKAKKLVMDSFIYRLLLANRAPFNHGIKIIYFSKIVLTFFKGARREKKINKLYRRMRKYKNTEYIATLYGMDVSLCHTIAYKRNWFKKPDQYEFEGEMMPVATDVNNYLTSKYGDYMQLPPENKRHSYHSFAFVDLDNSHEQYKGIYY